MYIFSVADTKYTRARAHKQRLLRRNQHIIFVWFTYCINLFCAPVTVGCDFSSEYEVCVESGGIRFEKSFGELQLSFVCLNWVFCICFRVDSHCSLNSPFPLDDVPKIRSYLASISGFVRQPRPKFRFEFTGILWEMVMRQEFWGDVAPWVRYLSADANVYIIPKSHYLSGTRPKVKMGPHVRRDVLINHVESEIRTERLPFVGDPSANFSTLEVASATLLLFFHPWDLFGWFCRRLSFNLIKWNDLEVTKFVVVCENICEQHVSSMWAACSL